MLNKYKGSAIHNLVITGKDEKSNIEGIYLGKNILNLADIKEGEEIIITRIGADSWGNRIKTIAFQSEKEGDAILSGSLCNFLEVGEKTCIIAEVYLDEKMMSDYENDAFPVFDLGFNPATNTDNMDGSLDLQYRSYSERKVEKNNEMIREAKDKRNSLLRVFAKSMVCGLVVTQTHPDCLQGSAEIPASVMESALINEYKSVSVYNISVGGMADTYAVPMPEGTVMTTGAMASFAKIGESVNIVSFILSKKTPGCQIVSTDGVKTLYVKKN